jgi:hypothetical protein
VRFWLTVAASLLGGCAGGDIHDRALDRSGDVRIEKSQTTGADYIVSVKNTVDFGHDPDDKATREGIATRMLRDQCPKGRIVGEDVIDTGAFLIGRRARTYAIKVKC